MRSIQTIMLSMALLVAGSMPALAQAKWDVTKTVHIGGDGGWDYLTVDSHTHQLVCHPQHPHHGHRCRQR